MFVLRLLLSTNIWGDPQEWPRDPRKVLLFLPMVAWLVAYALISYQVTFWGRLPFLLLASAISVFVLSVLSAMYLPSRLQLLTATLRGTVIALVVLGLVSFWWAL